MKKNPSVHLVMNDISSTRYFREKKEFSMIKNNYLLKGEK